MCATHIARYRVHTGYFRNTVRETAEVRWDGSRELNGDGKMKNGSIGIMWYEIGREKVGVE